MTQEAFQPTTTKAVIPSNKIIKVFIRKVLSKLTSGAPNMGKKLLRVAVVQMNPEVEQVEKNIAKAERLTDKLQPGTVDLVCFPEMAFTGYVFPSFSSLEPYLESATNGPTSTFCTKLASRLNCHVIAGYPEKLAESSLNGVETTAMDLLQEATHNKGVELAGNSSVLFGPDGTLIGGYRKTNLYEADLPWAEAGSGFKSFILPPPLHKVSIAICMDLNPQPPAEWTGSGPPHELADYCIAQDIRLLVLLCAWRDSGVAPDQKRDISTINYWCRRLQPLWDEDSVSDDKEKETVVVICNRNGFERGTPFCGTSTMLRLVRGSGSPEVVGSLGREEEICRIWSIRI